MMKYLTISLLIFPMMGCSSSSDDAEDYRFIIGSSTALYFVTSMHLNNMLLEKIEDNTFTDIDSEVLNESITALEKNHEKLKYMIENLYSDSAKYNRDKAILPISELIMKSTRSLERYSKKHSRIEHDRFIEERHSFVQALQELKLRSERIDRSD